MALSYYLPGIGAGIAAKMNGGKFIKGFISGTISGALFGAAGHGSGLSKFSSNTLLYRHAAAGALSGAADTLIYGGKWGQNMLSGAFSAWAGKAATLSFNGTPGKWNSKQFMGTTVAGGVAGGIVSKAYGGSFSKGFSSGAERAAYGYFFNWCANHKDFDKATKARSEDRKRSFSRKDANSEWIEDGDQYEISYSSESVKTKLERQDFNFYLDAASRHSEGYRELDSMRHKEFLKNTVIDVGVTVYTGGLYILAGSNPPASLLFFSALTVLEACQRHSNAMPAVTALGAERFKNYVPNPITELTATMSTVANEMVRAGDFTWTNHVYERAQKFQPKMRYIRDSKW